MTLAWFFFSLYLLDRLWKTRLVLGFRSQELEPEHWPTATILSPVTRGWCNLEENLESRRSQDYPGRLQHLVLLDAQDLESQSIVPADEQVLVEPDGPEIASKPAKLLDGLERATGDVLIFVDDDICLPSTAIRQLVASLEPPGVGATFGLAYAPRRSNTATRLLSAFINGNAPFSYLSVAQLMDPYTITGHIFAIPTKAFQEVGGLTEMEGRLDDDHELARRLRRHHFVCRQTSLTYKIHNEMKSLNDYIQQMQRWFIIPRATMTHELSSREKLLSSLVLLGSVVPPFIAICGEAWPFVLFILIHLATHELVCRRVYGRPGDDRIMLIISTLIAPLQVLHTLFWCEPVFTWRGRKWDLK